MITTPSKIKLSHSFFARNRHREQEYENIFSTTYKSLSFLSNIIFLIIFPPVIMIGNLFSHGVFLSILNISLSVGYIAKSIQKLRADEVGSLELYISFFFLCLSLAITFYLAPPIPLVSIITIIGFINLISTGVNSFFLIRNILLPPVETLIQRVFSLLGHEITTNFFKKTPFSLEKDRPVVDRLLRKFYKHDSFSDEFNEDELIPLNNMLATLSRYINKYNVPFLGNVINHEAIDKLENAVSQLIINGNTDNCTLFINKKIDFKTTKLNLLKNARNDVLNDNQQGTFSVNYKFFKTSPNISVGEQHEVQRIGLSLLTKEINRQSNKIESLKLCLPNLQPNQALPGYIASAPPASAYVRNAQV